VELAGKVALVTGASSGIGRAVALELADLGARVLLHGRDEHRLAEVAALTGGTALPADLAHADQRESLARRAVGVHDRVDVLVSNAGVGWAGPFTDMSAHDVRQVLEVDLAAAVDLTRLLLPAMVARGSGALCFVSSVAGRTGVAGEAVYSAAKAGLDLFAESLRLEARGTGVQVSVVVPGVVDTAFFEHRGRSYDRALPRPVSAQTVAAGVVRALADDRAEVWAPRWLRAAHVVRALAPRPYRRLSTTFGSRQRLTDDGAGGSPRPHGRWP
jgi:short-subunit dehydrogenase